MRCTLLSVLCGVLLLSLAASAQSERERVALISAERWLALVDAGNYAGSWDEAAAMFKNAVSKQEWAKMLNASRTPLGKLQSRQERSAKYETSLPGAPDGQYVVMQFNSSFEHKKSAVETVTAQLDKDGKWRVAGYFLK
jgi:hypothetical protein